MLKTLLKFSLVGLSGVGVNMSVYLSAVGLGAGYITAAIAAFLVAVTNNFVWNLHWTFQGRAKNRSNELKYITFLAVSVGSLGVNLLILHLLVESAGIDKMVAQLLALATTGLLNFILNYVITFRETGSEEALTGYATGYHANL